MKDFKLSQYFFLLLFCLPVKGFSNTGGIHLTTAPAVAVADVQQQRTATNSTVHFSVVLQQAGNKDATIKYNTADGSAKAGKDYIAAKGKVTIPAGSLQGTIDVIVTGDSLRQDDLFFTIELSAPHNCSLTNSSARATIINKNNTYLPIDNAGYTTPLSYPGKTLVWNDEFNGRTIDVRNWNFESGGHGWGNQELENYTARPENAFVSNGNLIIEARKENYGTNGYTSARMTTKGKKEFQYGRVDIRAKLPVGGGIWPALWMLGANISSVRWPLCGEIDIMELIGKYPSRVYATLHFADSLGKHDQAGTVYNLAGADFSEKFHVYSMIWQQDSIQMLMDDQPFFSYSKRKGSYPFNAPFFFIFNVAVGGQFPGNPTAVSPFPERMFVDYIRVFR
ncbi:MAG: hypothetical protein JWN76_2397 [Chitinophagaceae bacterium]|nr:hypothetical protein [Chitinophagaceae bacterium]